MLTTDLEPTEGNIYTHRHSNIGLFNGLSNKSEYSKQIGYCAQFDSLYDELTPSDHIKSKKFAKKN